MILLHLTLEAGVTVADILGLAAPLLPAGPSVVTSQVLRQYATVNKTVRTSPTHRAAFGRNAITRPPLLTLLS